MSNFDGLEILYEDKRYTLPRIAAHYCVSVSRLRKEIKERGFPPRSRVGLESHRQSTGRPPKLSEDMIGMAYRVALLGCDDQRIYETLNIDASTFYEWRSSVPAFSDAIHAGRHEAAPKVAYGLYRRAVGFTFKEAKVLVVDGEPEVVEVNKYIPPDAKAAETWLSRRERALWRKEETINLNNRTLKTEVPGQDAVDDTDDFTKLVEGQIDR